MIDWQQIKQLESDIGAEDFGDIIEVFIEEVDEAVENLRGQTGMASNELAPALHFLKGSALNLGFADFADACSKGEKMADAGNAVDVPAVIKLYDQSKVAFLNDVANHTSFQP